MLTGTARGLVRPHREPPHAGAVFRRRQPTPTQTSQNSISSGANAATRGKAEFRSTSGRICIRPGKKDPEAIQSEKHTRRRCRAMRAVREIPRRRPAPLGAPCRPRGFRPRRSVRHGRQLMARLLRPVRRGTADHDRCLRRARRSLLRRAPRRGRGLADAAHGCSPHGDGARPLRLLGRPALRRHPG